MAVFASSAIADTRSEAILDAFSQKISSHNSYSVKFTASADEYMPPTSGIFIVSGDKYYVSVSGVEVFFDGSIRQSYNSLDNELIVERSLPQSEGLLANPTNIFKLSASEFESEMLDSSDPNQDLILLDSIDQMMGPLMVYMDKSTGLISKIIMGETSNNMSIAFTIDQVLFDVELEPNTFSFDVSSHQDVEVIEF